ncbi:MAG: AAA family ATPase [Candidatus Poribacteria bacterium]|nr:AAA family ATPase [Candidatus Poribacteria bacterium]
MSETKGTQHPNVEIAVENFGPIAEANIDLRPLTVFVGPSNTGKTYFATLVYALHGTFNGLSGSGLLSPFEQGEVLSIVRQLLTDHTMPRTEIQDIVNKLGMWGRPFKLSDLSKEMRQKLGSIIKETDFFTETLQDELKNCFDLNSIPELIRMTEVKHSEMTTLLKVIEGGQEYWNFKMNVSESEVNLDSSTVLNISTEDDLVLLPIECLVSAELLVDDNRASISISGPKKRNRYYMPAARSGIMQSHRIIASSLVKRTTRVGLERFPEVPTMSGVIADFMERIILYEEGKIPNDEMKHLAMTLESDVLGGQIRVEPSLIGYPDFRYQPQGVEEDIRLSQTSSMVSELAPLVLFLRGLVRPGDTLIIEEPEAHLHPGAQADIAVILARLVRAGVRVIITTYSDWLLQEISNLTLEGLLEDETDEPASWLLPNEVGVWHFQKDKPVREIPFHPREGISPEDYEDVAEGLYNRSVNLQQRLEKKKGESGREPV